MVSSTLGGDLKGSTQRTKETPHLRTIWHDLAVFHRCLKLPQASSQPRNDEHRADHRSNPTTGINAGITAGASKANPIPMQNTLNRRR
jgi:hypothetical protein